MAKKNHPNPVEYGSHPHGLGKSCGMCHLGNEYDDLCNATDPMSKWACSQKRGHSHTMHIGCSPGQHRKHEWPVES